MKQHCTEQVQIDDQQVDADMYVATEIIILIVKFAFSPIKLC